MKDKSGVMKKTRSEHIQESFNNVIRCIVDDAKINVAFVSGE
jgi:hypothetical protein